MKQALYYAIRHNYGNSVIAVTSEKGTRRWHGRDTRYNETTHGTFDQLRGRFDSQEAAEAMRDKIAFLSKQFDERRKVLDRYGKFLREREHDAIAAIMAGQQPNPLPESAVVDKRWIASHNREWVAGSLRGGTLAEAAARATEFLHEQGGGIIIVQPDLLPETTIGD